MLPIIAVVDAVVVALYGAGVLDVTDLGDAARVFHVVLVGLAIFVVLLFVEVIMLLRTFGGAGGPPTDDDLEATADEGAGQPEGPVEAAPEQPATAWAGDEGPDLEALQTADELEGRQVIEVARPPKTAVESGIYATTYVSVNPKTVLRLEELVAHQGA